MKNIDEIAALLIEQKDMYMRIGMKQQYLSQSSENVVASNSQIRDTDFAKETDESTKDRAV